ncbi:MAG: phage holin family protein [Chloroflexota bacterium]|nr:phage holin family protein [Chloroflexota bacterium]
MAQGDSGGQSIFGLARELIGGGVRLARLELQHGRQEVGERLGEVRSAAILIAVALTLLFLALIALVAFIILGLATLIGLPSWLVALVVFVVLTAAAVVLGYSGVRRIRPPVPQETMDSVKEDIAWAKRLLRRG